ncbi:hypothetical protein GALL_525750 [mine drainage metagenome]|uniref:Uncharacterized protein n=1 Tax=mine drainage metagenome TaxID=410659 RepID=A0A1J5P3W0_9ZZZZ
MPEKAEPNPEQDPQGNDAERSRDGDLKFLQGRTPAKQGKQADRPHRKRNKPTLWKDKRYRRERGEQREPRRKSRYQDLRQAGFGIAQPQA